MQRVLAFGGDMNLHDPIKIHSWATTPISYQSLWHRVQDPEHENHDKLRIKVYLLTYNEDCPDFNYDTWTDRSGIHKTTDPSDWNSVLRELLRYTYARDLQLMSRVWPDLVAYNQVRRHYTSSYSRGDEDYSQYKGYNRWGFNMQNYAMTIPK